MHCFADSVPSIDVITDVMPVCSGSSAKTSLEKKVLELEAALEAKNDEIEKLKSRIQIHSSMEELLNQLDEEKAKRETTEKNLKQAQAYNQSLLKDKRKANQRLYDEKKKSRKSPVKVNPRQQVREILKRHFTDGQIDFFMDPKRQKGRWSHEDYQLAMTIKAMSSRVYKLILKKKIIPLPRETSLRIYFKDFKANPGYLNGVDEMLRAKAKTLKNPRQRVVNLSFDEVSVRRSIAMDNSEEQVIGPHKKANVMMMHGMFYDFKIPIWYRFDYNMSVAELTDIINHIEDAGFHVVSVTTDNFSGNTSVAKKMGATMEQPWFIHPSREDKPGQKAKIFWIFDPVHNIKLVRNWILDAGLLLQDGTMVNEALLMRLLKAKGDAEVNCAYKLTEKLVKVRCQERQRVLPAVQLLSRTTADFAKMAFPQDKKMIALSNFVRAADNWFDTWNSNRLYHMKKLKSGFEIHLSDQIKALETFTDYVKTLRVKGRKGLMPWQKGIISSTIALPLILDYLRENYSGIKGILVTRLNSDSLENLFSQLRHLAGNDRHFDALTFKQLLRKIILGAGEYVPVSKASPVQEQDGPKIPFLSKGIVPKNVVEEVKAKHISPDAIDDVSLDIPDGHSYHFEVPWDAFEDEAIDDDEDEISIQEKSEKEGFVYISGYLAKKSNDQHKDKRHGKKKRDFDPGDLEVFQESEWLGYRDFGGLTYPKKTVVRDVGQMNLEFLDFHKDSIDGLSRERGIITGLIDRLQAKFAEYDRQFLKRFSWSRTTIRIKHLQRRLIGLRETERSKRKRMEHSY